MTGLPSAASRTQASSHKVSVGQTRAHMPPMMLASKMVLAAPPVVGRDLADEERNVDRGRAGLLAGRIEAEIAALRLDPGLMPGERRMEVGEVRLDCRPVEAARRDVGKSWRVGGDRHGVSP